MFVSFISGAVLFYLFGFFPVTVVLISVSAAVIAAVKGKFILLPVILLGALYAFLRFSPSIDTLDVWNRELRLTGRFVPKAEAPSGRGAPEVFQIETAFDADSGDEIDGLHDREASIFPEFDADPGEEYEVLLKSGKDRTRLNPGAPGGGRLYGSVTAAGNAGKVHRFVGAYFDEKRRLLNDYVLGRFNNDSAALIASVTTGETAYLGDEMREAFNATGLAHILSISGTHFALFSAVIFWIFLFLIKRLPYGALQRLTIYLTPRQAAALVCLPFMIMYLGISGAGPPAVRSFVMISIFLFGLLLGRKGFWLNSLLFAAFLLVLWGPDVLLSISFQLSFVAVLFIGFAVGKDMDEEEDEERGNRLFRRVKQSVLLTFAASIGTAPLVAGYFHYFSLVSPLANLVATPLIGSVLVLLALVSSFAFLISGHYILAPFVGWAADLSVALVRLLAKVPFADIRLPSFPPVLCVIFYAGFIPYLLTEKRKSLLLLPFLPFIAYAAINAFGKDRLSVTFLDVGQGDSAVAELPGGNVIVIDTGRTGKETAAFLSHEGIRSIDALVVTHVHPDHSGGMKYILDKFRVKEIWDSGRIGYPDEMGIAKRRRELQRGDVIVSGDYRIDVLHPYKGFYSTDGDEYSEENNSSLVLKVSGKGKSFLFCGDVGEEAEEEIADLGTWTRADVIKIPHHGSRTSADEGFLQGVSPSLAVISAGRDNSFGHPDPEVLEKLSGAKVFRTDKDGAVKITGGPDGLDFKTYRDFKLQKADDLKTELENIRKLFARW